MDELMKKLVENQKDRIRAAQLPILSSTFLEKTLEKETLRTTCFRSIAALVTSLSGSLENDLELPGNK